MYAHVFVSLYVVRDAVFIPILVSGITCQLAITETPELKHNKYTHAPLFAVYV